MPARIEQILLAFGCIATAAALAAQSTTSAPFTTWRDYGDSADSMQYSALEAAS